MVCGDVAGVTPIDSEEALDTKDSPEFAAEWASTCGVCGDDESTDSSPVGVDGNEVADFARPSVDEFEATELFECFFGGLSLACRSFGLDSNILPMKPPIFLDTDAERPRLSLMGSS